MAAGVVVPCGFGAPGSVVLDALPTLGHLEIVPVHPGGAYPRPGPLAAVGRAAGVTSLGVQALRRIVGAVARLRGELVRDVTVRSDVRQLKVELESGLILVVTAERDGQGRPQLEVDVVDLPRDTSTKQQIEVRFD